MRQARALVSQSNSLQSQSTFECCDACLFNVVNISADAQTKNAIAPWLCSCAGTAVAAVAAGATVAAVAAVAAAVVIYRCCCWQYESATLGECAHYCHRWHIFRNMMWNIGISLHI